MDISNIQSVKDEINPYLPEDYEIKCLIAEGSIGTIYTASSKSTGNTIAIKRVKTKENMSLKSKIYQEFLIQKELKHDNIALVFGAKDTGLCTNIFMELLTGGDLFDLIPVGKGINILKGYWIYVELLNAVEFCHRSHIVHMDIKPENVMMSNNGRPKLIDFGLAVNHSKVPFIRGYLGTFAYSAPETFTASEYTGYKADLFSLNITFLTIITGERCWAKARIDDLHYKVWCDRQWSVGVFKRLPTDLLSFLVPALAHNPLERLSIDQIKSHKWFKNAAKSQMRVLKSPTKDESIKEVPKSQPLTSSIEQMFNCYEIPLSQPADLSNILMPELENDGQIVKRMSRFFSNKTVSETVHVLSIVVSQHHHCTIINYSPNCITVDSTSAGFSVTFRIFVYLFGTATLVDCRRIKGDGLLFHNVYVDIKNSVTLLGLESTNEDFLRKVHPIV